jgi:hypothetical protein
MNGASLETRVLLCLICCPVTPSMLPFMLINFLGNMTMAPCSDCRCMMKILLQIPFQKKKKNCCRVLIGKEAFNKVQNK